MIYITKTISIYENEITEKFIRSSGPGGQNVNKVATAVQLRFYVASSNSLPDDVRQRLIHLAGRRMSDEGTIIIQSQRFRSQERNRQDVLERLIALIRQAAEKPRHRRKTKPTFASIKQRLKNKQHQSKIKKLRQRIRDDDG